MSDDLQAKEESDVRELEREGRRLARLRLVVELPLVPPRRDDDYEPEPQEAA